MPSQNTPLRDIGGPLKAIGRWMASIDRFSALFRSPPKSPRRRRRGRRRRRHPPVVRRRGRRRHPPAVATVMMMVLERTVINVPSGERGTGEGDCGECRDELDLVHGMIPFFVCCFVFPSNRGAYQSADKSAKKRGADFAPVLRMERATVMAVVVTMVALRFVMSRRGRRRRCLTRRSMPWRMAHRRLVQHRWCPFRCFHRRRRTALGRRVPLRGGHCPATRLSHSSACSRPYGLRARLRGGYESAAHGERHHHLLYCLVHCRVPFVIRASPFSRLHKVRIRRRKFLTKNILAAVRHNSMACDFDDLI